MKLETIMQLVGAGYSKEEIQGIEELQGTEITPPVTEAPTTETPVTAQQVADNIYKPTEAPPVEPPVKAVEPPATPVPIKDTANQQIEAINQVMANVTATLEELRISAIRNSNVPEPETAEDAMAQIINPRFKKEGKLNA